MQKATSLLMVSLLLLCIVTGFVPTSFAENAGGDNSAIVFSDPVLDAKVRAALGKPEDPITVADAATLTWLDASVEKDAPERDRISSIADIRYLINLEELNLSYNNIHDITAITSLSHLRQLWLGGNPVDDLMPLGSLTGLTTLGFDGQMRELPFLANLTELEELNIGGCRTLPAALLKMKKLKTFCAPGGELEGISLLAQIPTLTAVDISWNLVSDLTPLQNLPLVELYIAGDPVKDYRPIRNIVPNLTGADFDTYLVMADSIPEDPLNISDAYLEKALRTAMNIQGRPITLRDAYTVQKLDISQPDGSDQPYSDIAPLAAFVNMYALNISNNQVSDISPLAGLTKLSWLNIRNNRIADLSPLTTQAVVEQLYIEGNPIADVTPLASIPALRVLYLNQQPTCDYAPLDAVLPLLEETNLQAVPADIPADPISINDAAMEALLRQVTGIQSRAITKRDAYRITAIQNGVETMWPSVSDISALASFTNLERLAIFGSKVSDLTPLVGLPKLNVLVVDDSAIKDLTVLASMKQLGYLEVKGNQITDVSPLASLTQLGGLDVSYNLITDLTPLLALDQLNVLRISHNLTADASIFKKISDGLKDKDFDPKQPMPTAAESEKKPAEGEAASAKEEWLQPSNPDEPIIFKDSKFEKAVRSLLNVQDRPITKGEAANVGVLDFTKAEGGDASFTDIQPLAEFTNLYELRLIGNGIKSIQPLAGLTGMRQLQLDGQRISDLSPLTGMSGLDYLSIKESKISKLDPLSGLSVLRVLDLSGNKIKDMKPLAAIATLEGLYLSKNQIVDLSPLSGLKQLNSLHITDNKIKDVSPLAGLPSLRELMLGGNKIKDFRPLATLFPALEKKDFTLE